MALAGIVLGALFWQPSRVVAAARAGLESGAFLFLGRGQAHSGDELFGLFISGSEYVAGVRAPSLKWGLGGGLTYAYSRRGSEYPLFESLITHSLDALIIVHLHSFLVPRRIEPYIGLGAEVMYLQETSIPPVILAHDASSSESDAVLLGGLVEIGLPIQIWGPVGVALMMRTDLAWLPASKTVFEEGFRVGGDWFGWAVAYRF